MMHHVCSARASREAARCTRLRAVSRLREHDTSDSLPVQPHSHVVQLVARNAASHPLHAAERDTRPLARALLCSSHETMSSDNTALAAFVRKAVVKAIETEKLAALHYRRLAEIAPDLAFAERVLDDAADESRHADALRRAAHRQGIAIEEPPVLDADLEGVRIAFEACARERDIGACLWIQDVFLEIVSIHLYAILARAAVRAGASAIEVLVDKSIVPDERLHLAHGLRDIARRFPRVGDRAAALQRAATVLLPALFAYSERPPDEPCSRTCGTCGDRCMKLDACESAVTFGFDWYTDVEEAAQRVGVSVASIAFA
jgi:hypothetical protein